MNWKRLALATAVGGFAMWTLAGIWHELVLASFYRESTHATHEGTGIILAAYLILGLLMAYLYPIGYQGGRPWAEGLRFGALIGVLWVFPHELALAGAHGEPLAYVFQNGAWHVVEQAVGGLAIALIYGRR